MTRALLLAAAGSLALLACATTEDTNRDGSTSSNETSTASRDAYVRAAAESDRFEIQSSQLALSRAQGAAVREFARTMVDHHTQSTERLYVAARAAGMVRTHDWMLPPPMQAQLEELQRASGAEFDRLYLRQQVQAHEAALSLHANYARRGDAAALRVFAAAAVPVVQQHLARARQID